MFSYIRFIEPKIQATPAYLLWIPFSTVTGPSGPETDKRPCQDNRGMGMSKTNRCGLGRIVALLPGHVWHPLIRQGRPGCDKIRSFVIASDARMPTAR